MLGKTDDHTALDAWKERVGHAEAKRVSKEATDRGELVHAYMEAYFNLNGGDWDQARVDAFGTAVANCARHSDDALKMAIALKNEVRPHVSDVWTQESALWSPTLKVAGRVDMIALWDGVPTTVDFKTSKRPKREEWVSSYFMQGTFYSLAHNELVGSDIQHYAICITCETGDVQVFTGKIAPWIDPLKARVTQFYAMQGRDGGMK